MRIGTARKRKDGSWTLYNSALFDSQPIRHTTPGKVSSLPRVCWYKLPDGLQLREGQPLMIGAPPSTLANVRHADAFAGRIKTVSDGRYVQLLCISDAAQRALRSGVSIKNDLSLVVANSEAPPLTDGEFVRKYMPDPLPSFWNSKDAPTPVNRASTRIETPAQRAQRLFGSGK